MALTIPYPDMDFVPLDILTANELDQMVANIEYIANSFPIGSTEIADGAITSTKIGNGAVETGVIENRAVTSDKIDFTTFPYAVDTYSTTASGALSRSINISAIPTGVRFAVISSGYVNLNNGGASATRISYNGSNSNLVWCDNSTSARAAFPVTMAWTFVKVSGVDTITLSSTTQTGLNDKSFATVVFPIG